MNKLLADAACNAVRNGPFASQPHLCQRFVREVVQAVYGNTFDSYWAASAALTARNFRRKGVLIVPLSHGSTVGDLLYKTTGSGGDGHVGIRVPGNRVAENSSLHWDPESAHPDARGFRTLSAFGHYDVIVRLPAPQVPGGGLFASVKAAKDLQAVS